MRIKISDRTKAWVRDQVYYWTCPEGKFNSKAHQAGRIQGLVTGLMVAFQRHRDPFLSALATVKAMADKARVTDQIRETLPDAWIGSWDDLGVRIGKDPDRLGFFILTFNKRG